MLVNNGADIYEIKVASGLPTDLVAGAEFVEEQWAKQAWPTLSGTLPDITAYKTLLIGGPVWRVENRQLH